VQLLIIFTSLY